MDTLISTILFIVALGLLICLHELGHFLFAKLFGVYCAEFSIGFGPALIHKRKEGKETYFSLRAIPLGGYVAMYGEDDEPVEEGLKLPPERSLEGIKKWKKAIIISAGIVVNTLISIILIGVSNFCFPVTHYSSFVSVSDTCTISVEEDERLNLTVPNSNWYYYEYKDNGIINAGAFAIIDDDVEFNNNHYVLTYTPTGNKHDTDLSNGLNLYVGVEAGDLTGTLAEIYENWTENKPAYYPNVTISNYQFDEGDTFVGDLTFKTGESNHTEQVTFVANANHKLNFIGISLKSIEEWLPLNERWSNTWADFGDASLAVFKGIGTLFSKNGIKNMSGLVGIFTYSGSLYSNYTFSTYLYFWGMISINLAIFNLLPFPGLDGWQLLVTCIEGISRKKLPKKFKAIMSFIGFALLMVLMIVILVLDVVKLI